MSSYHELETSTYNKIQEKPFTRILSKPDWHQEEKLIKEAEEISLNCSVSYAWSQGYGILEEIQGGVKYQAATGQVYSEPLQPPT